MAIQKIELSAALNSLATQTNIDKVTGMLGSSAANISKADLATVVAECLGKGALTIHADNVLNTSFYYIGTNGIDMGLPSNYGILLCFNVGTDWYKAVQIFISYSSSIMYHRIRHSSWSDWNDLALG